MNLDRNAVAIREAVDAGLLAGAVTLVWRHGRVLQVNEIGWRDVGTAQPMSRDTLFRIASMTKPVTVAAAMTLVDEGALALRDPVTRWLPELADMQVLQQPGGPLGRTVAAHRAITVEDLLTHRSGLAYFFSVGGELARAYRQLSARKDPADWLAGIAALPLVHQPGERLTYSNATDVLGVLLERIEGRHLHDVLTDRILAPLGMTDTGFFVAPSQRHRVATMYALRDGELRDDAMGPPPTTVPRFCMGGANLLSTADDYLAFARMLLGGGELDGVRVLSPESARAMRTDRLTAEQRSQPFLGVPFWLGRGFGLNLSLVTDPARARPLFGPGGLGTFGWPGAYGTWWQADPAEDLVLIYLVQNYPDLRADAAATVGGNTSALALQAVQPRFVHRTYAALTE